jgi:hypothetical protein
MRFRRPARRFRSSTRKTVTTDKGDIIELIDGGYCANNPTLYAIADAIMALKLPPEKIRLVSVGVGVYPTPKQPWYNSSRWTQRLLSVQLLQKTLEINTQSMDQLRHVLFKHVPTVRIFAERDLIQVRGRSGEFGFLPAYRLEDSRQQLALKELVQVVGVVARLARYHFKVRVMHSEEVKLVHSEWCTVSHL